LGKPLVTFKGWNGRWWTRIDYAKGIYDAATFVFIPWKVSVALAVIDAATGFDPEGAIGRAISKKKRRR
jgi:hypothetical protein